MIVCKQNSIVLCKFYCFYSLTPRPNLCNFLQIISRLKALYQKSHVGKLWHCGVFVQLPLGFLCYYALALFSLGFVCFSPLFVLSRSSMLLSTESVLSSPPLLVHFNTSSDTSLLFVLRRFRLDDVRELLLGFRLDFFLQHPQNIVHNALR